MEQYKIGIVGLGVVGSAVSFGIKKLGFDVVEHDIRFETTIFDLAETDVNFVCVPTPSLPSGQCDTAIVEQVVKQFSDINYKGIVAIKSTVEPGTTNKLMNKFKNLKICFVPEFLKERCAISDFIDNHDLCVIGTTSEEIYKVIKTIHGDYPDKIVMLSPTEAELVKYFNNAYNATLITFANNFYEICEDMSEDYTKIKNAVTHRKHITNSYLNCNKNLRGFGGVCLPKDTKALNYLIKNKKLPCSLFDIVLKENDRYEITTLGDMRK